jgi:nitrite reductase/ring-hydroxylating ferredoxin subunit
VMQRPDDLETDQLMLLHADGRRLVLGRTGDGFVAFDDRCTHRGASLADGVMMCGTVQCPWHGSQFDVQTGAVRAGPTEQPIATYRVEQVGDELRIHLT